MEGWGRGGEGCGESEREGLSQSIKNKAYFLMCFVDLKEINTFKALGV